MALTRRLTISRKTSPIVIAATGLQRSSKKRLSLEIVGLKYSKQLQKVLDLAFKKSRFKLSYKNFPAANLDSQIIIQQIAGAEL